MQFVGLITVHTRLHKHLFISICWFYWNNKLVKKWNFLFVNTTYVVGTHSDASGLQLQWLLTAYSTSNKGKVSWIFHLSSIMSYASPTLQYVKLPLSFKIPVALWQIMYIYMTFILLMFQRCIVMRRFYISHKQVRMTFSLPCAYAVFCGRFIITVNWDYLYVQKIASACLQRFSSIFETSVPNMSS